MPWLRGRLPFGGAGDRAHDGDGDVALRGVREEGRVVHERRALNRCGSVDEEVAFALHAAFECRDRNVSGKSDDVEQAAEQWLVRVGRV